MSGKEGFLNISEAPFLKYLLSFVVGIALQMIFSNGYIIASLVAVVSVVMFIYYYQASLPRTKFTRRSFFGYAALLMFVAMGAADAQFASEQNSTAPPAKSGYAIAEIYEQPTKKERSIECNAKIVEYESFKGDKKYHGERVKLYIEPDTSSNSIREGDIIIFNQKLQPIKFSSNPQSYDFASALRHQGFVYSQYIPKTDWDVIDHNNDVSFKKRCGEVKSKIALRIDSLNISPENKSVLRAILLGDTSFIDDDTREVFSASGLSHILAVSGLHIGIIALIIFFILTPLKWCRVQFLRPLITIVLVWGYLAVIAFPPSGVRAAIMATFVMFGSVINRKGTSLNSLFAAALFMLAFNPNNIYSVGFQLSFVALFSILYLYPPIFSALPQQNRVTRYLSSLTVLTIAVQIGTLPLSIYYFHQLPLLAVASNLIIIPLLPYIMGIAIVCIICQLPLICNITNIAFDFLNDTAKFVASLPCSSIDNIYIDSSYIALLFGVIFAGCWALKSKRSEIVVLILLFTSLFLTVDFVKRIDETEYSGVIYDDNKITAINFVDDDYNYVLTIDTSGVENKIEKLGKTFWIKEALPDAQFVKDSINDKGLYISLPYIGYKDEKFLILNSKEFKQLRLNGGERLYIHKAIVSEGFSGSLAQLTQMFVFGEVVLTSNLNHFKRQAVINECKLLNIPFYNIKEKGAYLMTLKEN